MRRRSTGALLAAVLSLTLPSLLQAQAIWRSETTGLFVSGHGARGAIVFENQTDNENGWGGGVAAGWGISQLVTVYAGVSGATIDLASVSDSYALVHVDVGARFNFAGPGSRFRPYANAALAGVAAGTDIGGDLFTISGGGLTLGGGIAYFLAKEVALDLGLQWTFDSFTEAEFRGAKSDIDLSATSARLSLGVSWWKGVGR